MHAAGSTVPPRWRTPAGEIVGWRDAGVLRATGIRYARAERYRPPTPEPPAPGVILATGLAPACPQNPMPSLDAVLGPVRRPLPMTEDCLRLSVTLPADVSATEALPVMVWIHGGSYRVGAGDAAVFDPRALVEEQRVIVVALTYRLGLLGFLGGRADRAANLGLLDMLEGLRWVRTNIRSFGGDPDRVTLFGQSAGGDAVAHLMIADGAEGLFRRVIIQSAPLGIARGRQAMTAAMLDVAQRTPVNATVETILAQEAVVAAVAQRFGMAAGMPFGTQYGHAPLPRESELDAAWARVAPRHDVLIGYAAEEASLFLHYVPAIQRLARTPLLGRLVRRAFVALVTRRVYGGAAARFAARHARAGGRVYTYEITWGSRTNGYGATHIIDMPLLFGDAETWRTARLVEGMPWAEIHRHAQAVRALWGRFARTGELADRGTIEPRVLSFRRA